MPIEYRHVYSSTVATVGHDEDAGELHVIWKNGKHSVYSNVPRDEFDSLSTDYSVGKAIHQRVKNKFEHRYVDE